MTMLLFPIGHFVQLANLNLFTFSHVIKSTPNRGTKGLFYFLTFAAIEMRKKDKVSFNPVTYH